MEWKRVVVCLFAVICSVIGTKSLAQADISMATHWYNRANYNPATITRPDYIYLFSNVRKQWAGVSGSPTVFNVQASGYSNDYHSALGISLINDEIGVTRAVNPMLTYAYRLALKGDSWLSMGLSLGVFSRFTEPSLFEAVNPVDPTLYMTLESEIKPDANLGFEYQSKSVVLGLSSTHLFSIAKADNTFLNATHIYGYATYKNTDSEYMNFNVGMQVVNRSNLTVLEGNACVRFKHATGLRSGPREIFELGVAYRSSQQMTFLLGVNVTNSFRIGYAFNQSFSVGYNVNSTHEIMLEYRIPFKDVPNRNNATDEYWYY